VYLRYLQGHKQECERQLREKRQTRDVTQKQHDSLAPEIKGQRQRLEELKREIADVETRIKEAKDKVQPGLLLWIASVY
jgi:peptidoglycan hydrolase CwlO-like protein